MKHLVCVLIVLLALVSAIPAGAVTASITLDVHQDVQGVSPNDFHVVGQVKSYVNAPTLAWHGDGLFTNFTYTITKTVPSDPTDPWYDFVADWSLPTGTTGIPYCTVTHLGLQFDVEKSNTKINLKGWWTLNGQPVGDVITGQHNNGFVPVVGFDVDDTTTGAGQKMRITNGTQQSPPLPAPPGPTPPTIPVQVVKMDVIAFHAGQAPSPDDLTETGAQASWNWVPVNNSNGQPISPSNSVCMCSPASFFDIFMNPTTGSPSASTGVTIEPGGFLVARTLNQFTNNAGQTESRWEWEVHEFSNTLDWRAGDEYKSLQMPDATTNGIDIRCDRNDQTNRYLADDFKCIETGPITDIHFWGSWLNDIKGNVTNIHVAFFQDVPAVGNTPSHPADGNPIWEQDFATGQFSEKLYMTLPPSQAEWFWDKYTGNLVPKGDTKIYQYDISITLNPFVQKGTPQNPITYWMGIYVTTTSPGTTPAQFGWKTRDPIAGDYGGGHFMDDAAWKQQSTWVGHDFHYPAGHPNSPNSLDMSFVLTGQTRQRDWGDAPDSVNAPRYPTLSAHNGASHGIIPGFCLGKLIDGEPDGQPNANATGDDINNLADEDGVTFNPIYAGGGAKVLVVASAPGFLDAWMDFNANGSWADAGEQIFTSIPLATGANWLNYVVPNNAALGNTFARFRFSSTGGLSSTGPANDGEVEDYKVTIIGAPPIVNKPLIKKGQGPPPITVLCPANPITWNFGANGWYFEESSRQCGLGVNVNQGDPANGIPPDIAPWVPGDIVSCVGTVSIKDTGELMLDEIASWKVGSTTPLAPILQINSASGGGAFGYQPGVTDLLGASPVPATAARGVNSVGLYVKLFGKCTQYVTSPTGGTADGWFDDGSGLWDGTTKTTGEQVKGVKVHFPVAPTTVSIVEGNYYAVTGIMRTYRISTTPLLYGRELWATDVRYACCVPH